MFLKAARLGLVLAICVLSGPVQGALAWTDPCAGTSIEERAVQSFEDTIENTKQRAARIADPTVKDTTPESIAKSFSHGWLITCSMLNGIGDLNSAAAEIESRKGELVNEYGRVVEAAVQATAGTVNGKDAGGSPIGNTNALTEQFDESITSTTRSLRETAAKIGTLASGENSIYKRSLFIGFALLFLTFMLRITSVAYKILVRGEAESWEALHIVFRLVVLIFFLVYLKSIVLFGMALSDAIKQTILSGSGTGTGADASSTIAQVQQLLQLRREMANIQDGGIMSGGSIAAGIVRDFLGSLAYYLASAVIFVLLILGDVMMALTVVLGPVVIALSMVPNFENYMGSFLKSYITFLFYGPMAALYVIFLIVIMAVGIDQSFLTFIVISIAYILGATKIPDMAKSMSGAAMAGVATGIAAAPAVAAMAGAKGILGLGAKAILPGKKG